MDSQPWILGKIYSRKHEFTPVGQALSSTRMQVVATIAFLPLLNQWAYLDMPVMIVLHRVHIWVKMLMSPPIPRGLQSFFQYYGI